MGVGARPGQGKVRDGPAVTRPSPSVRRRLPPNHGSPRHVAHDPVRPSRARPARGAVPGVRPDRGDGGRGDGGIVRLRIGRQDRIGRTRRARERRPCRRHARRAGRRVGGAGHGRTDDSGRHHRRHVAFRRLRRRHGDAGAAGRPVHAAGRDRRPERDGRGRVWRVVECGGLERRRSRDRWSLRAGRAGLRLGGRRARRTREALRGVAHRRPVPGAPRTARARLAVRRDPRVRARRHRPVHRTLDEPPSGRARGPSARDRDAASATATGAPPARRCGSAGVRAENPAARGLPRRRDVRVRPRRLAGRVPAWADGGRAGRRLRVRRGPRGTGRRSGRLRAAVGGRRVDR